MCHIFCSLSSHLALQAYAANNDLSRTALPLALTALLNSTGRLPLVAARQSTPVTSVIASALLAALQPRYAVQVAEETHDYPELFCYFPQWHVRT
jgi:hypothetical protein